MNTMNHQIVLAVRPEGLPKPSDFQLVEAPLPEPANGQFLVKTNYLSVDPYMRGRISEAKSYAEPVQIGQVMVGGTVGTVVESRHPFYKAGDVVVGYWGWQEYAISDGQDIQKFDASLAPMSTALGVLGMPGMTAYFGLLEIGKPKPGETVFVSGAAGAVGSLAGQIAKIKGCRVVRLRRIAGRRSTTSPASWASTRPSTTRTCRTMFAKLQEVCPQRDRRLLRQRGRSAHRRRVHADQRRRADRHLRPDRPVQRHPAARGPRLLWHLIVKRARAEGFLVFQFANRYAEGQRQVAEWIKEGKVKYQETIVNGLEYAPTAFIGLFHGENIGKQLVRVAKEQR